MGQDVIKECPIQISFYKTSLYKKWTLAIIRDMLLGHKHFSDFLKNSPDLSAKVLSQRLKELESEGIIKRYVLDSIPVEVEYELTPKGFDLNKILYEFSMYGAKYYTSKVFGQNLVETVKAVNVFGGGFQLSEDELEFHRTPTVTKQTYIDAPGDGDDNSPLT